ncbi:polygalacturonase-like [Cucurbita moschata]|uniref:Polygalacturonase-like n=1 Tax=Cucurbita moschata TaxID=3662 RepID=A0A6J1EWB1_CUCMO|nr:polygalacturonase-like [Cucurbita moschata]
MSTIQSSFLIATILMLLLLDFTVDAQSSADVVFPLKKYGNIVSGTDITKALANAWKDACTSNRSSAIVIPGGIFKVKEGIFKGPCEGVFDGQGKAAWKKNDCHKRINYFTVDAQSSADVVFPLKKYGNIVSGTDITKALANAWKDACTSNRSSAIVIPGGIFKVKEFLMAKERQLGKRMIAINA